MGLSLSWHERAEDLPAALWEQGFAAPLEGLWWYRALERSALEDQFRFLYALVRDGPGEPVAIAPAFVMDVALEMFVPEPLAPVLRPLLRWFPALARQRTLFVGSPCADRGWVGLRPGADRLAVLRCVQQGLQRKADELGAPMRVWKDFPQDYAPELSTVAAEAGLFRVVSLPGSELALQGSRRAYLDSIPGSGGARLERNVRRSQREVELDATVEQSPNAATLDEVFGLFCQTYERATTRFERLGRSFFEQMAGAPASRFILLRQREDRRLVAFMLCFDLGPTLVNKFIGFDYARPRDWRLYFRLWDHCVELALALGKQRIESGQTGYAGKLVVGHRLLPLTNYCQHRQPLLRWLYRSVGARVTWESLDPDLAGRACSAAAPKNDAGRN